MKKSKGERLQFYLTILKNNPKISFKLFLNYAVKAGINDMTARRDIKELEMNGYISIQMGLITSNNLENETPRFEKHERNVSQKNVIGKKANEFIDQNDIFVCAGTTIEYFVKQINKNVKTLYTNGFEVAKVGLTNSKIENIFVVGGALRKKSWAMAGPTTNEIVNNLRFSLSFICANRIDEDGNLYNQNDNEASLIKEIRKVSKKVVCLIDSSKFSSTSSASKKIINIRDIDLLITDAGIDERILLKISKLTKIIVAE